ncbi:histone PARylation factor 1 isoform X1 [Hemiscyllium ocellatum]|uniref:histone PARylation factor 1 isoform X1 n=1 Tax=Hemiscyllium ocellatum TaxID=170820 RepID=UPI00296749B7|nr:histone PARylation factor 1 isoform X1 [Hemiscyllium ocellatum]
MAGRGKRKAASRGTESKNPVAEDGKKNRGEKSGVPEELRQEVEDLYKLRMPEDFYHFWEFCEKQDPQNPCEALKSSLGLQLVGPFDILAGKHKGTKTSGPNYLLHWRYFYDPPEFQTIISGDPETLYHLGYFRDSPDELPVFIGENEAKNGCSVVQMGNNVFSAVNLVLSRRLKEMGNRIQSRGLKELETKLSTVAKKLGYSLEQKTKEMKQRDRKVATRTFHGAGLVVPIDKAGVGYRELPETDGSLKKICKAIVEATTDEARMKAFAPIQEIITYVQFANDECDYGMGYELGIDLFCYGSHYFHKVVQQLLPLAYKLLKRQLFAEIIEVHLANRKWNDVDQLTV